MVQAVVQWYNGTVCQVWLLIDLDAGAQIGHERKGGDGIVKYSEAAVPPEWQALLYPDRTDGLPRAGQPTITAWCQQDIWQFGVLLFGLCTGVDLFPKDVNDDTIATSSAALSLAHWTQLRDEQAELVFSAAFKEGKLSKVQRVAAMDLISVCLCGNSGEYGNGHPSCRYSTPVY